MKDDIRKTQADLIRAIKRNYQIMDGIIFIRSLYVNPSYPVEQCGFDGPKRWATSIRQQIAL